MGKGPLCYHLGRQLLTNVPDSSATEVASKFCPAVMCLSVTEASPLCYQPVRSQACFHYSVGAKWPLALAHIELLFDPAHNSDVL